MVAAAAADWEAADLAAADWAAAAAAAAADLVAVVMVAVVVQGGWGAESRRGTTHSHCRCMHSA